ncbi:hypothetical protein L1987_81088 [Smallanthus sonchifolius]|uniref:Uncharacterized protein n=1 Tax=Smallanthus sonchifolius TaxID=185202 RepID=A0ACB8YQJ3_9ASTR|nr:hypothetical protein L1987_81088 [Smallanthus sonchifolius]
MGIGCAMCIKTSTLTITLVVLMLLSQQGRAGVYSCWGGCLNQCLLLPDKKPDERVPCYWNCLAKCFPQPGQLYSSPIGPTKIWLDSTGTGVTRSSPASEIPGSSVPKDPRRGVRRKSMFGQFGLGRKYYCIIGCSFQSCMKRNRGKTDLKTCLVRCKNKCK